MSSPNTCRVNQQWKHKDFAVLSFQPQKCFFFGARRPTARISAEQNNRPLWLEARAELPSNTTSVGAWLEARMWEVRRGPDHGEDDGMSKTSSCGQQATTACTKHSGERTEPGTAQSPRAASGKQRWRQGGLPISPRQSMRWSSRAISQSALLRSVDSDGDSAVKSWMRYLPPRICSSELKACDIRETINIYTTGKAIE